MQAIHYFLAKFDELYWNPIKWIGYFKHLIRKVNKKTKVLNSIEDYMKLSEIFLDIIGV